MVPVSAEMWQKYLIILIIIDHHFHSFFGTNFCCTQILIFGKSRFKNIYFKIFIQNLDFPV